jgi:enterochelin esterase family protein
MRLPTTSILEVPASPALLTEWQDVPHGTVHQHWYASKVTGTPRRMHVYTPPGYERSSARLPLLLLFHGRGDADATWTVHGRANLILDNLIARKQARPMVVVMTEGHLRDDGGPRRDVADTLVGFDDNTAALERDLNEHVLPLIEATYRVRKDSANRAIVGLSMGGHQALTIGIHNAARFAWVVGFSAAAPTVERLGKVIERPAELNRQLRLLWIACGKDDFLIERNRALVAALGKAGIKHEWRETEGAHTWMTWRTYLAEILPRLFAAPRAPENLE